MNRTSLLLLPFLAACSLAPDYQRPAVDTPAAYKESGAIDAHWQPAALALAPPEKWWEAFKDPLLDQLQEKLILDNQNIKLAEAQYRAARAGLDSARAGIFPTLGAGFSASRSTQGAGSPITDLHTLSAQAGWEIDLWGRVRSGADAARAQMDASEATLGAARLSAQALLAQSYFQLRSAEAQIALRSRSVAAYERLLQLTRNRLDAGVASPLDATRAETQLNTSRAQLADARLLRAQTEHAIATLLGKPAADISIEAALLLAEPPPAPELIPSLTLERRYDIAAAERRVAAANARIGVARAAWFPILNLSAGAGFRSSALSELIRAPARFWSLGPGLALSLFDGGARSAAVEQTHAEYDQAVATYRQTVLAAFQEVEDNLVAMRLLAEESTAQRAALAAARRAREIAENQYRAGTGDSLNLIAAQTDELNAENAAITLWNRHMAAAVLLYKNLGGRQATEKH